MLLSNQAIALVTGAAQGIGRAISLQLAREGAKVALLDLNGPLALEAAREISAETGQACIGLGVDVGDENEVARAVAECVSRLGVPTILVNNAALLIHCPLLEISRDQWDRVFRVNVTGSFLMTKECGRIFASNKYGRIVNISSCSARKADQGQAAYNSTKSALIGLTRVTALELGPHNVTCNAVLPGAVDTEMTRKTFLTSEAVVQEWIDKTALKRLGKPEDIAKVVLFLCSSLADHITGESIVVSAGELMTQ